LLSAPAVVLASDENGHFRLGRNSTDGGATVWQELVRMAVTWGVMVGLTAFFYWMLSNIGTF
jgi:hypothetical protein